MKRSEENRYAHSATLFHFCKEALNIKHNFEVKIIDQHVGAILGFDPADCSHWKRGKKNIHSIHTINTIAEHLEIDPRIVNDIVSGQATLEESLQEFRGYGHFWQEIQESTPVSESAHLNREHIQNLVSQVLEAADIRSCPVMIPELLGALQNVVLLNETPESGALVETTLTDKVYTIRTRKGDVRAHIRFLVAREIGRILLCPTLESEESSVVVDARLNTFAMLLLMPTSLLQMAARDADNTTDLVQQLSQFFWLGRSLVNARLKDFFAHGN
jgi:hypothetical protein